MIHKAKPIKVDQNESINSLRMQTKTHEREESWKRKLQEKQGIMSEIIRGHSYLQMIQYLFLALFICYINATIKRCDQAVCQFMLTKLNELI